MLNIPAPYPHPGSKGFQTGTGAPLTVIQQRADGRALVRMDARPGQFAPQGAGGNRTLESAELAETIEAAMQVKAAPRQSRKAPSSRRTRKARR